MNALAEITEAVARSLARHADALRSAPLVVAVSGGLDSTALALALAGVRDRRRPPSPEFWIAHVDHGQHPLARAAAAAAERLAVTLRAPFREHRLDLPADASEASMRDARYAALLAIAREARSRAVLTAHHRDDQAETVLMRMLRGTGHRGLAGIPERRVLADGVVVLRPLLSVPRARLLAAVRAAGVAWIDDPTNADPGRTRAAVRHVLLPDLVAEHPDAIDALTELADAARSASAATELAARAWLEESAEAPAAWRIDLRGLDRADAPTRREAFRLLHLALAGAAPLQTWLRRMDQLAEAATGARLAETLFAERTRDGLLLLDPRRAGDPPSASVRLPGDGTAVRFGSTEWVVRLRPWTSAAPTPDPRRHRAVADAAAAPMPWRLRTARPGDTFDAPGLARPISLRSALRSRKIPRYDRDRLPLVVDASDRVVWAPGLDVAAFARVPPGVGQHAVTIERLSPAGGIALPQPSY